MRRTLLAALFLMVSAAQGAVITFSANLTPDQEIPPPVLDGATPSGFASATVTYDPADLPAGGLLEGSISWSGLTSPATMAHIHRISNPNGTGPVVETYFMETLGTTGFVNVVQTLNQGELVQILNGVLLDPPTVGALYFNLHSQVNPPGEIRGNINSFGTVPDGGTVIPEPSSYALIGAGLVTVAVVSRRK